jgi:hypothetical protein
MSPMVKPEFGAWPIEGSHSGLAPWSAQTLKAELAPRSVEVSVRAISGNEPYSITWSARARGV